MLNNHLKKHKNRNAIKVVGAFLLMGALLTSGYTADTFNKKIDNKQTQEVVIQKPSAKVTNNTDKKETSKNLTNIKIDLKGVVGLCFFCIILHLASKGLACSVKDYIEAWHEKKQYDKEVQAMIKNNSNQKD